MNDAHYTESEKFRIAKAIYTLRRQRDAIAGFGGLFGEPGWDILLDLYIAARRGKEIQVSSVCIEAGVPSTTILRWITRLEREGLVYREADVGDGRRRYVRLTPEGNATMDRVMCVILTTGLAN